MVDQSEAEPAAPLDGLLSPKQTAERLGISVKTLRGLVSDGVIARIIVGRGTVRKHYAFDPADVEAFIRQRREWGACLPPRSTVNVSPRRRGGVQSGAMSFLELRKLKRR